MHSNRSAALSRGVGLLTVLALSAAMGWSSSAPSGALAVLGEDVAVLLPDGTVWTGQPGALSHRGGLPRVTALAAGRETALALTISGEVYAWGASEPPSRIAGLTAVAGVACGDGHCLAWRPDKRIWTWGRNTQGQLGDGATADRPSPGVISLPEAVRSVAGGARHSLAVTVSGRVLAWGSDALGQIGTGADALRPTEVPGLANVVAVSAGRGHSLALLADGTVAALGDNRHGQLGIGDKDAPGGIVLVPGLADVVSIAAGQDHSVALLC